MAEKLRLDAYQQLVYCSSRLVVQTLVLKPGYHGYSAVRGVVSAGGAPGGGYSIQVSV
ncbi:hypothetical protein F511_23414 [Dorcoceras hygrometricum]|uniref:Uncharacterized protein n=1 Tax=Dorcoceras hygrometricum TaxID=472368 RepID=A0A2Z7A7Y2_9LAMI|nr:hypothetical protein F511_23414 [Dorcoceras hygrometricum]